SKDTEAAVSRQQSQLPASRRPVDGPGHLRWRRDPMMPIQDLPQAIIMETDPLPGNARLKSEYEASDARAEWRRPPARSLRGACRELGAALASTKRSQVKQAGVAILELLSKFYGVRA